MTMLKMGFFILLILITILTAYEFKQTDVFPIKEVKVFGAQRLEHAEIQHIIIPLVKKGFFAVDVEAIQDRLFQLPWIGEAYVRRVWPDQIVITLIEKSPVARWNNISLLSSKGELFSPTGNTYPVELPEFVGSEGAQILMLDYFAKISNLLQPLHCRVSRLELTPAKAWNITLDNKVKLTVGYKDSLTRISHFVKVYPRVIGNRIGDVEYIDLRYSNGLAIKWRK